MVLVASLGHPAGVKSNRIEVMKEKVQDLESKPREPARSLVLAAQLPASFEVIIPPAWLDSEVEFHICAYEVVSISRLSLNCIS